MEIIEVKDLSKNYGRLKALDSVSLTIRRKEIFGLLGPNGAGKSTLISILAAINKPSSGDILVKGFSVTKQPRKTKPFIGFVPQDIAIYTSLSGMDNLDFWAGIYGLSGKLKKERIEEALSTVRLHERSRDRVDTYSGGMKRRLNIAVALLHHPEILVMDEPTAGVDIQSRRYITEAIGKLRDEGRTVIFTSHYIDEMESLCDRIAILGTGTIEASGTLDELLDKYGAQSLEDIMLNL